MKSGEGDFPSSDSLIAQVFDIPYVSAFQGDLSHDGYCLALASPLGPTLVRLPSPVAKELSEVRAITVPFRSPRERIHYPQVLSNLARSCAWGTTHNSHHLVAFAAGNVCGVIDARRIETTALVSYSALRSHSLNVSDEKPTGNAVPRILSDASYRLSMQSLRTAKSEQRFETAQVVHPWKGPIAVKHIAANDISINSLHLDGHLMHITDVAWSPLLESVLAACTDDGYLHVWDLRQSFRSPAQTNYAGAPLQHLRWNSLYKERLICSSRDVVFVWDGRMPTLKYATPTLEGSRIVDLAWYPNRPNNFVTVTHYNAISPQWHDASSIQLYQGGHLSFWNYQKTSNALETSFPFKGVWPMAARCLSHREGIFLILAKERSIKVENSIQAEGAADSLEGPLSKRATHRIQRIVSQIHFFSLAPTLKMRLVLPEMNGLAHTLHSGFCTFSSSNTADALSAAVFFTWSGDLRRLHRLVIPTSFLDRCGIRVQSSMEPYQTMGDTSPSLSLPEGSENSSMLPSAPRMVVNIFQMKEAVQRAIADLIANLQELPFIYNLRVQTGESLTHSVDTDGTQLDETSNSFTYFCIPNKMFTFPTQLLHDGEIGPQYHISADIPEDLFENATASSLTQGNVSISTRRVGRTSSNNMKNELLKLSVTCFTTLKHPSQLMSLPITLSMPPWQESFSENEANEGWVCMFIQLLPFAPDLSERLAVLAPEMVQFPLCFPLKHLLPNRVVPLILNATHELLEIYNRRFHKVPFPITSTSPQSSQNLLVSAEKALHPFPPTSGAVFLPNGYLLLFHSLVGIYPLHASANSFFSELKRQPYTLDTYRRLFRGDKEESEESFLPVDEFENNLLLATNSFSPQSLSSPSHPAVSLNTSLLFYPFSKMESDAFDSSIMYLKRISLFGSDFYQICYDNYAASIDLNMPDRAALWQIVAFCLRLIPRYNNFSQACKTQKSSFQSVVLVNAAFALPSAISGVGRMLSDALWELQSMKDSLCIVLVAALLMRFCALLWPLCTTSQNSPRYHFSQLLSCDREPLFYFENKSAATTKGKQLHNVIIQCIDQHYSLFQRMNNLLTAALLLKMQYQMLHLPLLRDSTTQDSSYQHSPYHVSLLQRFQHGPRLCRILQPENNDTLPTESRKNSAEFSQNPSFSTQAFTSTQGHTFPKDVLICYGCRRRVQGLCVVCRFCSHGGHPKHVYRWLLQSNGVCGLANCLCHCSILRTL